MDGRKEVGRAKDYIEKGVEGLGLERTSGMMILFV